MLVVVGDGVRGVFVFVVVVVVVVANECSNLKRRAIVESPFPWWLEPGSRRWSLFPMTSKKEWS